MSRLTWAKAKPALAGQFAQWPELWPQRLAPVHLARLQAPPNGKDWSLTLAFDEAITRACAAGELAHVMAGFVFPPVVAWASLDDSPGEAAARWQAQFVARQLPAVTADDFVAWLVKQGETPSAHITAWLGASREALPTARRHSIGRDLLAPVIDRACREARDPTDTAAVMAELERLARLPGAERPPPLAGVTSGGIRWMDGGETKTLTRKALGARLKRLAGHRRAPPGTARQRT